VVEIGMRGEERGEVCFGYARDATTILGPVVRNKVHRKLESQEGGEMYVVYSGDEIRVAIVWESFHILVERNFKL
jgi:hypothetical protein